MGSNIPRKLSLPFHIAFFLIDSQSVRPHFFGPKQSLWHVWSISSNFVSCSFSSNDITEFQWIPDHDGYPWNELHSRYSSNSPSCPFHSWSSLIFTNFNQAKSDTNNILPGNETFLKTFRKPLQSLWYQLKAELLFPTGSAANRKPLLPLPSCSALIYAQILCLKVEF